MTKEEIIEMVEESDLGFLLGDNWMLHHELEYFAKLVAEHEREACADLLMGLHEAQSNNDNHNYYHFASNAIKELRGQE